MDVEFVDMELKKNGAFGFEKAQSVPNRIQEKSNIKPSLMNIKSEGKEKKFSLKEDWEAEERGDGTLKVSAISDKNKESEKYT